MKVAPSHEPHHVSGDLSARRWRRLLAPVAILAALTAAGIGLYLSITPSHATGTPPRPVLTNAELAAAVDGVCDDHPGACHGRLTPADLPRSLHYVCSLADTPATHPAAWVDAYPQMRRVLVASGRC